MNFSEGGLLFCTFLSAVAAISSAISAIKSWGAAEKANDIATKANDLAAKALEITNNDYRVRIIPELMAFPITPYADPENPKYDTFCIIIQNTKHSSCTITKVTLMFSNVFEINPNRQFPFKVTMNSALTLLLSLTDPEYRTLLVYKAKRQSTKEKSASDILSDSILEQLRELVIRTEFEDELGNPYYSNLKISKDDTSTLFNRTIAGLPPERINKVAQ